MRIVVCVKEVLDPDAVNSFAVAGRLVIGEDGKTLTQSAIPRLMNGYDEQAIEAALRLRDAGASALIAVGSIGRQDFPMVMGITVLGALFIAVANLIVDVAYAALDPRVRYT